MGNYKLMKKKAKVIKARVNPQGLMGSAFRVHKPKKGKGSYSRKPKHGGESVNSNRARISSGALQP
jgi:stalled ribosome alternative rescue factor ArfA